MIDQPTATPKLYIGINIHKRNCKVHYTSELFSGKTFSIKPKPEMLKGDVDKHFKDYVISTAYEAGADSRKQQAAQTVLCSGQKRYTLGPRI
uniref:hypothetical protein n=1 Tax=Nonlabens xiamenensis TaxID=2341043 RepID=UPI0013DDFFC5|nr:hypothetical protein [Nonlabens xiamenensis]